MSGENTPTATAFCNAFLDSYFETRAVFSQEQWKKIWIRWNDLVLLLATEPLRLPEGIQESALTKTARRMGLRCVNRELLRLDAIFSRNEEWFPIEVAVEHENDYRGFVSEVKKLLSVRCPLKVGITYTYTPDGQEREVLNQIEQIIRDNFGAIKKIVAEDTKTGYLFLVGTEIHEEPREIRRWYSLDFLASNGPESRTFQLVRHAGQHLKGVA